MLKRTPCLSLSRLSIFTEGLGTSKRGLDPAFGKLAYYGPWWGFWLTPDRVISGGASHQEMLGNDTYYEDAFNKGWVKGYIQSGDAGIEARSLVNIFPRVQAFLRDMAQKRRIDRVLVDLNGRSYSVPLDDFLRMNKSNELRAYQYR